MSRPASTTAAALCGLLSLGACTPTQGVWEVACGTAPAFEIRLWNEPWGEDPAGYNDQYGEAIFTGPEGEEAFPVHARCDKPRHGDALDLEVWFPEDQLDLRGEVQAGSWEGRCEFADSGILGALFSALAGAACPQCGWDFPGASSATPSELEGALYSERVGGRP